MSKPESKTVSNTMEEVSAISNIKSKLKVFESLTTPVSSNSKPRALNATPSGLASIKGRLQAFEVLRTVASDNARRSTPIKISPDIPSLKSRMKALQGFDAAIPDDRDVHLSKGATDFGNKTLTVNSGNDNGMVHPQSVITKRPTVSVAERYSRSIASGQIVAGDLGSPNGDGQKISQITSINSGSVKIMVDFFHAK